MSFERLRYPILGIALLTLLSALWAGLIRLGWAWPTVQPFLPQVHGPLMVSGFLGTLISLERAVAIRKVWSYLPAVFSALGALAGVLGLPLVIAQVLFVLGGLGLAGVFVYIVRQHRAPYTVTMALGALCWLVGNVLWLLGKPVFEIVLLWGGFLTLTIAGERLELGRLLRLSPRAHKMFLVAAGHFLGGLVLYVFDFHSGTRMSGVGMIMLALWLLRFDIARFTVRKPGLPRYAALCLMSGYVWLGLAGVFAIVWGGVAAGPHYDALLHAIFLGFVFAMIFGHAPIIFPAVTGRPVRFSRFFYTHLVLLHISLAVRIFGGDVLGSYELRLWGGLFNGITMLIFLGATLAALRAENTPGRLASLEVSQAG